MDFTQRLPEFGPERTKFLQATVDEAAKYEKQTKAAQAMGIRRSTLLTRLEVAAKENIVCKYLEKKAEPALMPKGTRVDRKPYTPVGISKALLLPDVHVPYHNEDALMIALEFGASSGADCILLNGDFLDCADLSFHEKIPSERAGFYDVELPMAGKILSGIKKMFPKAKKIYNEGNHEYRVPRYLAKNSKELYRRDHLVRELKPEIYDFEFVYRETPLWLGKLNVIHGDEYRGGGSVNVARTKFMQAAGNVIFGHHHRTQQYIHKAVRDQHLGAWAMGCLCDLSPSWLIENQWNLGFAFVTLDSDGGFHVENKMIIKGQIY